MSEDKKIRILIADDQVLFAHLLKTVLETRSGEFEVIGIAHNGQEALVLVGELKPDVVLLDISMPVLDGVQTARELVRRGDRVKIMVLTTFDDPEPIRDLFSIGVGGYILKDCDPQELFVSIQAVYGGGTSLSPRVIKKLMSGEAKKTNDDSSSVQLEKIHDSLNRREQEILLLLAEGFDNKEIASRLFVAEQTVKNNISNIYEKLEIHDRAKLVKLAEAYVVAEKKPFRGSSN